MRESQNIKNTLERDTVINIIKDIAIYNESLKHYVFNKTAYKRMCYYKKDDNVISILKKHYYESKNFYLTRKRSYKTFTTIIRQICKYANLKILSDIKYQKSSYVIEYYIHLE